ncbi:hypothetical protein ACKI2N_032125 [Cupriavidus sp. 30B13]|uniref:hypothetical protein n=1 Tax=unclassified Cupriavidus TaxID=2640874 RepID=UPI0009DBEF62|nr:hypothetical protein [Cupriavidus sp. WS]
MNASALTYLDWVKALPSNDDEYASTKCPCCGSIGIRRQYFGFEDGDFGWKLVWCDACKQGIQLSRVKLPADEFVLRGEVAQKEFLSQHKDLKLAV